MLHPELKLKEEEADVMQEQPMVQEVENMPMMFEGERTEMHKDAPSPKRQRMVNIDNTCQTNSVIIIDSDNMSLSHLSSQECMKLAYALGKHEATNVRDFALKVSNERNMEQLMKLDLKKYLSEMNAVVWEFICGVASVNSADQSDSGSGGEKNVYKLCKSVESILNLSAAHTVLPVHFRESVLLYVLTGSKLALTTVGGASPHSSYWSVRSWLSNLSDKPSKVPTGDIMTAFDNNQILQRRWRVTLNNVVQCNVATMIIYFDLDENGQLQFENEAPSSWMSAALPESELKRIKFLDQDDEIKAQHYLHLHTFLARTIDEVQAEHKQSGGDITDSIDQEVHKEKMASTFKKCENCGNEQVPKMKRNCPLCKKNIKKVNFMQQG